MEEMKEASGQRRDYFLPASILVAGIMISGSIVYLVGNKNSAPAAVGNLKNQLANVGASAATDISSRDVILGDPKAPVAFIEYGDYQCPFCGKFFTQVEPKLRDEYIKTGKVKMVFKNFQFLGSESTAAGAAAECAKDQKQFWAYHDALYAAEIVDGEENNGNLKRSLFLKLASDLKLDIGAFTSCLDGNKYVAQIEDDTSKAQSVGVNSTPTTFVNGRKLSGALPYEQFKAAIDTALEVE
ncbi:MAG: DsbA family protein [Candidatus Liptonbacteria bacterium]|nr:DsbA family protein [Candidatus Liptonbacteria bacterium]